MIIITIIANITMIIIIIQVWKLFRSMCLCGVCLSSWRQLWRAVWRRGQQARCVDLRYLTQTDLCLLDVIVWISEVWCTVVWWWEYRVFPSYWPYDISICTLS
jgi:hypothetical protein